MRQPFKLDHNTTFWHVMLSSLALVSLALADSASANWFPTKLNLRPKRIPSDQYEPRDVAGWTVRVNRRLLNEEKELGGQALKLLEEQLRDIKRVVPVAACRRLQEVPIWLGYDEGYAPCAQYHVSKEWLTEHGYNADMAKAVEISSSRRFLDWSKQQPWMMLHELAHAYHDRVLTFDHAAILAAFKAAKDAKLYDEVLHVNGRKQRGYAMVNHHEYFAEGTEALFGKNDFYPFVRGELEEHDPRLFQILNEVWNAP